MYILRIIYILYNNNILNIYLRYTCIFHTKAKFFSARRDSVVSRRENAKHVRKLVRRRRTAIALSIEATVYRTNRRMELYSRAGWIFIARLSRPERIFLVTPESALCDVIESRERSYASQRVISPSPGTRERFVPAAEPFRSFNEATEWLSCRSIRIYFLPREPRLSARRGDARHRCYQATTKREQPAQSCLRIDLYPPFPLIRSLHLSRATSLLVSSVRFRRIRNPTFKHARRLRLMKANRALLYSDCDKWSRYTCIVQLDIFVLHKEEISFKCITKKLGTWK